MGSKVAVAVRTFSADTSASRTWRLDWRSWNIRGAFICIVLDGQVFLVSRYFHGAGEARFHELSLCHEVASDLLCIWVIDQSFDPCILTFGTHSIFVPCHNHRKGGSRVKGPHTSWAPQEYKAKVLDRQPIRMEIGAVFSHPPSKHNLVSKEATWF